MTTPTDAANQAVIPATANTQISTMLADYQNDDFAGARARDLILPRATLMQPLSPEVMKAKFPAGAIVDKGTGEVIIQPRTPGSVIIPLMFWLEWIEWNKSRQVDKAERIVERSVDPSSKLAKRAEAWETYINSEGREICTVTEYYNFIAVVTDETTMDLDAVYVVGFSRSSHKTGKMWLNRLMKSKLFNGSEYVKAPICANKWAIKTEVEEKKGHMYWSPQIGDGKVNHPDHLAYLLKQSGEFKSRRADIMDRNSAKHDDESAVDGAVSAAQVAASSEM